MRFLDDGRPTKTIYGLGGGGAGAPYNATGGATGGAVVGSGAVLALSLGDGATVGCVSGAGGPPYTGAGVVWHPAVPTADAMSIARDMRASVDGSGGRALGVPQNGQASPPRT